MNCLDPTTYFAQVGLILTPDSAQVGLACQGLERPGQAHARQVIDATFCEFGLPEPIRSDNGPPFAVPGAGGLTALSLWWIKLGITPERIEPGKPQKNGRHERMHRTLKKQTANPPAANLAEQQVHFEHFRQTYNLVSRHPSGYATDANKFCWPGCDPAGYLGFCLARWTIC